MSNSSSIGSGRDHTSTTTAAAASLPTKRSHKMMDTKSTNNDSVCTNTLFASGMERLKAAQIELINAQNNMESIRQQIHNSGDVEPDSLLCLCDKEDNYILSYIMNYLDVDDLGRCELVCSTLNKQAKKISDKLSEVRITNYTGKEPVPKDVTFVGLHPNVIEISKEAFKDCSKLRHVVLNEGLVSIRKDAFRNCTSLASIKFPSTLIEIADSVFKCSNLKKVVLNDGLQKLGDKVFGKCTSLKSIILPPNLIELGYYVFSGCTSLTDVVFNENEERRMIGRLEVPLSIDEQYQLQNPAYDNGRSSDSNLKEVVFHTGGLRSIEKGMFSDCKSLERIKLSSTIRTIEESAFYECFRLREVVVNQGLWRIDCQAFFRCLSLESITLTSASTSFSSIESCSFRYCTSLREVILREGLKKIKDGYGYGRSSLEQIDSQISWYMDDVAFAGCRSLEYFKFPYISARLERIIQVGHTDIETKINEICGGVVEWKSNELVVSAAETTMISSTVGSVNWRSVKESLNKIVNLLAFYEMKEGTVLFELALWKAKIDHSVDRAASRTEVPRKVKETILQFMFRGYGS